jgi:hypothetical protein
MYLARDVGEVPARDVFASYDGSNGYRTVLVVNYGSGNSTTTTLNDGVSDGVRMASLATSQRRATTGMRTGRVTPVTGDVSVEDGVALVVMPPMSIVTVTLETR